MSSLMNKLILKCFAVALLLILLASIAFPAALSTIFVPRKPATSTIVSNTGVWLDGGTGAGDLTDQITIYPDCTSSTPFQCTKLMRTDNQSSFIWTTCTTPSCLINGAVDGGYGWAPIPLSSVLNNTQGLSLAT